jgi:hypothetical protein
MEPKVKGFLEAWSSYAARVSDYANAPDDLKDGLWATMAMAEVYAFRKGCEAGLISEETLEGYAKTVRKRILQEVVKGNRAHHDAEAMVIALQRNAMLEPAGESS